MHLLFSKFVKVLPPDGLRVSTTLNYLYESVNSYRVAAWCLKQAIKHEGGEFYSSTARKIMQARFGVSIGAYSHGSCFEPVAFGPGTTIGRYVSMAQRVRAFQGNHPADRLSMHGFFCNSALGYVPQTNVPVTVLRIEHDAWIGDSVIITPGCRRIGLGAVIGAGSIVTKDVPDFAVVAGNPAKLIRWRFSPAVQEAIRQGKWWELPVTECARHLNSMTTPLGENTASHPLLRPPAGLNPPSASAGQ